jgi:NADPH:quinone reductase-like Zn-dependent oxidoreductase
MAEQSVVPEARCVPLPDSLDDITAAAIAIPGMSSWAALNERARFAAGETVLVNGATSTSGQLAVQIAKHLGATKVIATGRNAIVLESLKSAGADVTISLEQDPGALSSAFEAQFRAGVDIVLDYLWGPSALSLLIAAAKASAEGRPLRFVQIGSVSGADIPLPSAVLRSTAITLLGSGIGSVPLPRLLHAVSAVFNAVAPAQLRIATQAVPLAALDEHWAAPESSVRKVFTPRP